VVACSIPLVLAMVFVFMEYSGITMQRISLGALIIALGLLVDDAMITVEMMVTRLEMGETKEQAATFAYTSTAFPMLTGTLVTVAGFVPIGLNASSAGEYTFTLFAVIAVALLVSWVVAVLFAPVLGVHILSTKVKPHEAEPGRIGRAFKAACCGACATAGGPSSAPCVFVLAVFCMRFVQNQFFPSSDRPEILVDLNLPQNASIEETRKVVDRSKRIKDDPDIVRWSTYIGQGAIRFYLPLDQQLQNPYYAQLVIVSKGFEEREAMMERLQKLCTKISSASAPTCSRWKWARRWGGRSSTGSAARTSIRCASTPSNWRPCWTRTSTSARSFTTGTSRAKCCASTSPRTRHASWACRRKTWPV
jgi:multidrug efflux pump subunit AcrB